MSILQKVGRGDVSTAGGEAARLAALEEYGVLDTLRVLGLGLSVAANAPLEPVGYGVFRM